MTVRINDFDTARDTPLEKWFALYEHLSARGYKVFVIPDQHDVMFQRKFEKFPWNTIQEAAMSLDLRLALHQECHTTLSWGGGVAMLLWYSTAKFLMYGSLNGKSGVSSAAYYKSNGITVGEQPEYFFPSQKKDWVPVEDITVEYLVASSEAYLKTLET